MNYLTKIKTRRKRLEKVICIIIVFAFSLFYCLNCDKAFNPVQSDISSEQA